MSLFINEILNYYPDRFPTPGLSEISMGEGAIGLLLAAVITTDDWRFEDVAEETVKKVFAAASKMRLLESNPQDEIEGMCRKMMDFYKRYGAKPVMEAAIRVVPLSSRVSVFETAAGLMPVDQHCNSMAALMNMAFELKIPEVIRRSVLSAWTIKSKKMRQNGLGAQEEG
ncbi:MAG: hypothetical protein AAF579_17560 [Cyanobacteria bacterium P01_C01_bin.118]